MTYTMEDFPFEYDWEKIGKAATAGKKGDKAKALKLLSEGMNISEQVETAQEEDNND